MFTRAPAVFAYVLFVLAILTAATPDKRWGTPTTTPATHSTITTTMTVTASCPTVTAASQCNTGNIRCCNSVTTAGSSAGSQALGLVGAIVPNPSLLLGLTCSPLTGVGLGSGSSCSAQPVCCEDNSYGGFLSIGCVPININL